MTRIEEIMRKAILAEDVSQGEAHAIMAAMLFTQKHLKEIVYDREQFITQYGTWGYEYFEELFNDVPQD